MMFLFRDARNLCYQVHTWLGPGFTDLSGHYRVLLINHLPCFQFLICPRWCYCLSAQAHLDAAAFDGKGQILKIHIVWVRIRSHCQFLSARLTRHSVMVSSTSRAIVICPPPCFRFLSCLQQCIIPSWQVSDGSSFDERQFLSRVERTDSQESAEANEHDDLIWFTVFA